LVMAEFCSRGAEAEAKSCHPAATGFLASAGFGENVGAMNEVAAYISRATDLRVLL